MLLGLAAQALLAVSPRPTPTRPPRRVALRFAEALAPEAERLVEWGRRRGVEVQTGAETAPVPQGFPSATLSVLPPSDRVREAASAFAVSFEGGGFTFDGRAYRGAEDAVFLSAPDRPLEALVLGNSPSAVVELAGRRLLRREGAEPGYEVASGALTKTGRFAAATEGNGRRTIDRASDRDRIGEREAFFRSLRRESRGGVDWEFPEAQRAAVARWEKPARAGIETAEKNAKKKPFTVRLFPDAVTKGLYTGSTRPADLAAEDGRMRVDVDLSAPPEPDLVSPVLAAAGLAAADPALAARRTLLLAAGARRFGKWWGRDVRGFGAFARAAKVEPTPEEVLRSPEEISPVIAVGAAAAWLDAGVRLDGERAAERALREDERALRERLARWRDAAARQTVVPPSRRPLPSAFVRGVSYAMTNALEDAYVSPRSLESLRRLRELGADSVSIMPFAFSRELHSSEIAFVHRSPRGETDEGTLRAVADARSLGMSAMVKPQLWVGDGAFVGEIAMADERAWRGWFDSYRRFVVHHAIVAEAAGAALFCVGAELTATEGRKNDWRELVSAVRLATGAPLLYAANWAANAAAIPFWDDLDVIGVDFYDPLAKTEKVSDAQLEEGARQAARPLAELAHKLGKPVVFAEAGFPAVKAAWIAPHDEGARRPSDPAAADAARAIAALDRALAKEAWWRGVYWWKAFSDGKPAEPGERGYNFVGTAAEKAIRGTFESRR